ncbi:MAG: hypothetical protein KKI06_00080 [Euryarchaeota archaeon]|nr:hypothetical protein [Euryarchaeota archaeon]
MTEEKKKLVLTIDPKTINEGVCEILNLGDERVAVCKENDKLKIFSVKK